MCSMKLNGDEIVIFLRFLHTDFPSALRFVHRSCGYSEHLRLCTESIPREPLRSCRYLGIAWRAKTRHFVIFYYFVK